MMMFMKFRCRSNIVIRPSIIARPTVSGMTEASASFTLRKSRKCYVQSTLELADVAPKDAKDTGLANLPYADAASNAIWIQVVLLAMDLTTWAQQLALTDTFRLRRATAGGAP